MKYLGITQKTANWLLSNSLYLSAFQQGIINICNTRGLSEGVVAIGALRISAHLDNVLCIWNSDYLSGTDYEEWGFIRLYSPLGLFSTREIINEVIERELYIINQRLQGLLLGDDRFIHRSLGENSHTCLAGRGEVARRFSVGWYENTISDTMSKVHSLVCIGPSSESGFDTIRKTILEAGEYLPKLIDHANHTLKASISRPILDLPIFIGLSERFTPQAVNKETANIPIESLPQLKPNYLGDQYKYESSAWTYEQWITRDSSLNKMQRAILESDILLRQPLRIVGSAGSGKSLLMQLLTMRRLLDAKDKKQPISILYVVHNSEMENAVWKRFEVLGAEPFLMDETDQQLHIRTLSEHCRNQMELSLDVIIDKDAAQTKAFQRDIVSNAIKFVANLRADDIQNTPLLAKLFQNVELMPLMADLVGSEIGVAIKGRGLTSNRKRYVESERPLTRFHGILNQIERDIIFEIFERYHKIVFEELEVLDSDDIAISFLSQLRTPLWDMQRKKLGFDYVFVDETQLFNQNERQLFRLLPKKTTSHLPIALALDEAQELRGALNTGFGLLGFDDIANETLTIVHRSTPSILKLAYFVIQRTTDLFGPEFPDFTKNSTTVIPEDHPLALMPRYIIREESPSLAKTVLREYRGLVKSNIRQIAIVVHSERYWNDIYELFKSESVPIVINARRGQLIDPQKPIIIMTTPESIGGQEFDAVISVGLEYGIVPPVIEGNAGLTEALEQQALREMYLVFTRARYQLLIINSKHSTPNSMIQLAINNGLIINDSDDQRKKNLLEN